MRAKALVPRLPGESRMRILGPVLALLVAFSMSAAAQTYVQGYTRQDGTYVQGHWRSSPDNSPHNNYSYPGNTNPYTGKTATGNPDTYLQQYYGSSSRIYTRRSYVSPYSSAPRYYPRYTSPYSSRLPGDE